MKESNLLIKISLLVILLALVRRDPLTLITNLSLNFSQKLSSLNNRILYLNSKIYLHL